MQELLLKLSDKLFEMIKNDMGIKKMCGNIAGSGDGLLFSIINAIENGEEELALELKDE